MNTSTIIKDNAKSEQKCCFVIMCLSRISASTLLGKQSLKAQKLWFSVVVVDLWLVN